VNSFTIVAIVLSPIKLSAPCEFGNYNLCDFLYYCHIRANDIWKISKTMFQESKILRK